MPALLTRMSSRLDLGDSGGDRIREVTSRCSALRRSHGCSELLRGGEIDVGDLNKCPGADEFFHGGFADAACAARDQGVAAIKAKAAAQWANL